MFLCLHPPLTHPRLTSQLESHFGPSPTLLYCEWHGAHAHVTLSIYFLRRFHTCAARPPYLSFLSLSLSLFPSFIRSCPLSPLSLSLSGASNSLMAMVVVLLGRNRILPQLKVGCKIPLNQHTWESEVGLGSTLHFKLIWYCTRSGNWMTHSSSSKEVGLVVPSAGAYYFHSDLMIPRWLKSKNIEYGVKEGASCPKTCYYRADFPSFSRVTHFSSFSGPSFFAFHIRADIVAGNKPEP